jgi:hypothetical protein
LGRTLRKREMKGQPSAMSPNGCQFRHLRACRAFGRHCLKPKVMGETSLDDCIHIATAVLNKVEMLVSWNYKHIVNIYRIRGYNSINLRLGHGTLEIHSPKEIVNYENEE